MGDAPERIAVKKTNGYQFNWYGVVTDIYDERGVEYIRADLAPTDAQVMANEKVRKLVEAVKSAFDCGMVPNSTAKNGGASSYARTVVVADMLRDALRDLEAP